MTQAKPPLKPPSGIQRWFFRMPIWLYRLRLGGLLGHRFLMIEHIGRKTGELRRVVVEVIHHDDDTDAYYVASGFGYRSNWYLNIMAKPEVTIHVGWRKLHVLAEQVEPERAAQILLDYREHHGAAAREVGRFMGLDLVNADESELETMIRESLPIISFTPLVTESNS